MIHIKYTLEFLVKEPALVSLKSTAVETILKACIKIIMHQPSA